MLVISYIAANRFYISFCREDSPDRIQKVLQNAALGIKGILSDPPPDIRIVSFEGYANKYEVMYYVDNYKQLESIRSDFLKRIHYATRRNHLNIAVPTQRQFQLDKEPDMGNPQVQILESLLSLSYFNILDRVTLDQLAQTATIETYGVDEMQKATRPHSPTGNPQTEKSYPVRFLCRWEGKKQFLHNRLYTTDASGIVLKHRLCNC